MELVINFYNEYQNEYDLYYEKYYKLGLFILEHLNKEGMFEISVSFVNNDKIRQINRDYRNIDKVTDVISFEYNVLYDYSDDYIELGDIFISIDKALLQAKEYGNSIEREMMFLFCHGFLHCLGYDHLSLEDEKIMFALQKEILNGYKEWKKRFY